MGLGHSPSIVVDGLVFMIDPNNTNCYPGFGNTVYNLVNPTIGGTFVGYTSNPIDNTENRTIAFDGSTNFIQTNYYPFFSSDFTIEVFVKFTRYNNYQCVLSSMNNGSAINGFWFEFGSDRGFTIYTTGSQLVLEDNIVSLTNLDLNKWHHLVATRSGTGTSNVKLYVNNLLCGQNSSNAAIGHSSYAMMIGKYDYVGNYSFFKGNVGIVRMYNKGLSAEEILQNYNATKKKYSPEENIVTNGLVLYIDPSKASSYPGTGNTIYDLSGFGNTGTLTNGPTFSALNGGSIVFDGTNDYIDYPRSNIYDIGSSDFTVMYWINTTTKSRYNAVIDLNDVGGKIIIATQINTGYSWTWFTSSYNIVGTINMCDGRWHLAAISRIGSTLTHYVDGQVSVTTNVGSTVVSSNNFLSIGKLWQTSEYGQIQLADVKIYKNKGLTQQEIQQNYNATKNRFINVLPPVRNGLVLELDPTNTASYSGTGNTWYDLSGSRLNGTLLNGASYSGSGTSSSFVFDGVNDRINFGTVPANTTGSSTIGCWAKTTTTAQCMTVAFNAYGVIYINRFNTSGKILAFFDGTTSNNSSADISNSSVNDGKWHYIIATNNGSTCSMYIDGVFDKSYSETPSYGTNAGNTIGGQNDGFNHINGSIGFAHIYNRALSAYEIKQNFDYYRTRYNI